MANAQPCQAIESQPFEKVDPNSIPPSFNEQSMKRNNTGIDINNMNIIEITSSSFNPNELKSPTINEEPEGQISYAIPPERPKPDYNHIGEPLIIDEDQQIPSPTQADAADIAQRKGKCQWFKQYGLLLLISISLLTTGIVKVYANLTSNPKWYKLETTNCMIQGYTATSCDYTCDCYIDISGDKTCDECQGFEYRYSAMCYGHDGLFNQSLLESNGHCPEQPKQIIIGEIFQGCIDNDSNEFFFECKNDHMALWVAMITVAVPLFGAGLLLMINAKTGWDPCPL